MERIRKMTRSPGLTGFARCLLPLGYYLLFFAVFALLLWKCRYGFADMDESLYLAIPYRFARGDRMLLNEWHLSQFSFFTMIPTMWVYLGLAGTTEGILLAFRYIYTVCWCAGSLFLYLRVRKINPCGAACASLFMMIYAPLGIMTFFYNSLCILYLVNAAVFLICARRHQKVQFAIAGLFFAGAVLCCPFLVVIYLGYSALLLVLRLQKKNPVIPTNKADVLTCWKYFTLGVCILAVLFLSAVLIGTDLGKILESLHWALQDPEHANLSFLDKTATYFRHLLNSSDLFIPTAIIVILMIGLTLYRKREVWFCVVCAAAILYLRSLLQLEYTSVIIDFLMLPMAFVGIYVMAVTKWPSIRWVGILWLIPGIIYTFCLNYSSNQTLWAIASASSVPSIASFVMMWMYCDELRQTCQRARRGNRLWAFAFLAALACFVFQFRYGVPVRYQSVYWEPGLMKYEEQRTIERGPEKGIIATVPKADLYSRLYEDVRTIDHQKALFLSEHIWMYLVNQNENASYSGWLHSVRTENLERYYRICPEKKPEIIFLEADGGVMSQLIPYFDNERFDMQPLESGNYLVFLREGASWPEGSE